MGGSNRGCTGPPNPGPSSAMSTQASPSTGRVSTDTRVRAKRTAEIVAEELKLKKRLKLSDALKYENNPEAIISQIATLKPMPKNLLLVGHEPYLSHFISKLVSGNGSMAMDFKKGGLCKLEVENLREGTTAQLVWLLTPKLMKEMA